MQRTLTRLVLVFAITGVIGATACGGKEPDPGEGTSDVAAGKIPDGGTGDAADKPAEQRDAASSRDGGDDGKDREEDEEKGDGGDGGKWNGNGKGKGNDDDNGD